MANEIDSDCGFRALEPAASAACQLARRVGRAVEDLGHLVEGDREHVVEHERDPLGRTQEVEHDEQRGADRLREHHFARGVVLGRRVGVDVAEHRTGRLLGTGGLTKPIEADAADHGGEEPTEVSIAPHRSGAGGSTSPTASSASAGPEHLVRHRPGAAGWPRTGR